MTSALTKGKHPRERRSSTILILIGALKLIKAALMILAGLGALHLLHDGGAEDIRQFVRELRVDPDNHFIHGLLERLFAVTPAHLKALSFGTFLYAALFTAEGIGLVLQRRWAEYVTVVTTALFLPFEIYELTHRVTVVRISIFVVNIAIVAYLIARLRSSSKRARHAP